MRSVVLVNASSASSTSSTSSTRSLRTPSSAPRAPAVLAVLVALVVLVVLLEEESDALEIVAETETGPETTEPETEPGTSGTISREYADADESPHVRAALPALAGRHAEVPQGVAHDAQADRRPDLDHQDRPDQPDLLGLLGASDSVPAMCEINAEAILEQCRHKCQEHHCNHGHAVQARKAMSSEEFERTIMTPMFQDLLRFSRCFAEHEQVRVLSVGFDNWSDTGTCFPMEPVDSRRQWPMSRQ